MKNTHETLQGAVAGLRTYGSIFWISLKNQLAYLVGFLIRNLFFVVIMFVFFSLWKVIYGEGTSLMGLTIAQTIWYLTFSETIALSTGNIWREIQEEVKDGTLAYGLLRPYSYPLFRLFQGLGESVLRLLPMLVMGFLLAFFMVGPLPGYSEALLPGILLLLMGQISLLLAFIAIGLLAFWMEEVAPVFWLWQKALFVLGGLFLPLEFFPDWIRPVILKLPFAYGIYWPSRSMVDFSWPQWWDILMGQLFWNALLLAGVLGLFSLARRRVHLQGG